ncbi:MAG: hypothetical protein IJR82_04130 [Bacilli bacterium]|nr:hypothetical protein [Bacilli bacterium]
MKNEKEMLIEDLKHYAIILDDYINKRLKYTINTEYLEEEIKVVSACLLETIDDYEMLLEEEK